VLAVISRNLKAGTKVDRSLVNTVVNAEKIHIRFLRKTVAKHVDLSLFTRYSWM
jgi:hypothetical protein